MQRRFSPTNTFQLTEQAVCNQTVGNVLQRPMP
jgi:hypothetical protein